MFRIGHLKKIIIFIYRDSWGNGILGSSSSKIGNSKYANYDIITTE